MRADWSQHGFESVNNGLWAWLSGGWDWRGQQGGERKARGIMAPGGRIGLRHGFLPYYSLWLGLLVNA